MSACTVCNSSTLHPSKSVQDVHFSGCGPLSLVFSEKSLSLAMSAFFQFSAPDSIFHRNVVRGFRVLFLAFLN